MQTGKCTRRGVMLALGNHVTKLKCSKMKAHLMDNPGMGILSQRGPRGCGGTSGTLRRKHHGAKR